MTNTARQHNRIDLLIGSGRYDEFRANAAGLLPGTALAVDANGQVGPHATAGTCYEVIIALQHQKAGKLVTDPYALGDVIPVLYPGIGDVVALVLESGQDCDPADLLTVTNSGTFKVASSTDHRLFRPLDTVAGTGSADRFVRARRVA